MRLMNQALVLELRRQLEGTRAEISHLGSETYHADIKSWSETCEKDAGAIVKVTSAEEVSKTIVFARRHNIEFVAKAGGHSTSSESATRGGIVISLERMRDVVVDPASKTVRVQGGCRWEDVNQATTAYGLGVVGATASQTGVSASALGGGFGWLTGQYGLISDNLVMATMVLADGSVLETSEDRHNDLFWAIRGAGQAFGIATELVFKAHSIPDKVFGGSLNFEADKLATIVAFANRFHQQQDEHSGFFFGFRRPSPEDECVVMTLLFYNGPIEKATAFFEPVLSLQCALGKADMMSYTEVNRLANVEPTPKGRKWIGGTEISFPLEEKLAHELWLEFDRLMHLSPTMDNSVLAFELLPYGQVTSVPIEATACANRGHSYNAGLLLCWQNPDDDPVVTQKGRALLRNIRRWQPLSYIDGDDHVRAYANYAGHNYSPKYVFGVNLPRLQELKRRYDPHNAFHKWHNLVTPSEDIPR
jgi:FAD/FMN-containing dehydrogenase